MTQSIEERLKIIRATIEQERRIIIELRGKVSEDLGQLLRRPLALLDFVEGLFLDPSILAEERTAAGWDRWIGAAHTALGEAIALRSYVNQLITKYGPDAKIVG